MPDIRPSITVTKDTTLQDVRQFTRRLGDDDRIRGKIDKEGNTILYVGKKSPGLFSILTGQAGRRKERAKNEIERLVNESVGKITSNKSRVLSEADRAALKSLSNSITSQRTGTGNHSMRAGLITWIADAVKGAEAYGKAKTESGPGIGMMGGGFDETIRDTSRDLHHAIHHNLDIEILAFTFGNALAKQFKESNPDLGDRVAFLSSDGEDLKEQLLEALKNSVGDRVDDEILNSPKAREFLDIAFNRAATLMAPTSEIEGTGTVLPDAKGMSVPDLKIGETVFKPVKVLGEGAFAYVFLMESVDPPGKTIAYKIAKDSSPEAMKDVGEEIRAHHALYGEGHDNVLAMQDVIRTEDGRLGIVLEYAPGGNAYDFSTKLLPDVIGEGPGKVPPEFAEIVRLTLLKNIVEGTSHIQNTQGGIHADLKTPNVMIGDKGFAKIGDFGMSRQQTTVLLDDIKPPDNPLWLAPEILKVKSTGTTIKNMKTPKLEFVSEYIKDQLDNVLPRKGDIDTLTKNIMLPAIRRERGELSYTNKGDTWAVGVMALDIFTGHGIFHKQSFMSKIENSLKDFGGNRDNMAIGEIDKDGLPTGGALSESTGIPEVDTLINKIMRAKPEDRPDLQTIIDDPVFAKPGVGSDEVGRLILAIKSGDPDKIDQAVSDLREKIG